MLLFRCWPALVFTGLAGLFKGETGQYGGVAKFLVSIAYLGLPILLILISAILLNENLRTSVPLAVYKWPSVFVAFISLAGLSSLLITQIASSAATQSAIMMDRKNYTDENHLRILSEIEACDVMKGIGPILIFSGDNQPDPIQSAAVSKIKSNPQWEQELVQYLESNGAPEAFQFLASNDVDNPSIFIEPIRKGILNQARLIRERIRKSSHPSHFYAGMFSWDVERAIRTVDKFQDKEASFLPEMKELRAALDESSGFDKPKFREATLLDKWIKAHS